MLRVLFSIALTVLGCAACAHHGPLPQLAAPAVIARTDAPPIEREATFSIPITVPISELSRLLQERLQLPSAPDWELVTAPDQSPEVELRYEAELLPPRIALVDQTLVLTLQIAYFGAFRARLHTPFGWVRLSKNTSWGDRDRRGLIELEIHSALSFGADYQLQASSTLHDLRLTAPPIDKLCAGGAFKVCVPAEMAVAPIHRELERRVRAQVDSGLALVDGEIRERASLARVAERIWQRLNQGLPLATGEQLALRPRALSISPPALEEEQLSIRLGITAAPLFASQPAAPAPALPPAQLAAPLPSFVPLTFSEPLSALNAGLSASARASNSAAAPARIELLGPAANEARWIVALGLESDGQQATVYGEAALACQGDSLRLDSLTLTPESVHLLKLAKIDDAALLAAALAATHRPGAQLSARAAALRSLIAESLAPFPVDALANPSVSLVSVRAAESAVLLEAELR